MRPNFNQVTSLPNPQLSHLWKLIFPAGIPNTLSAAAAEQLDLRCQSTTEPTKSMSPVEIYIRGIKVIRPSAFTPEGTITLSFVETIDQIVSEAISGWRKASYNVFSGAIADYSEIMTDIILIKLDNLNTPVWYYRLLGCMETGGGGADKTDGSDTSSFDTPTLEIAFNDFVDGSTLGSIV